MALKLVLVVLLALVAMCVTATDMVFLCCEKKDGDPICELKKGHLDSGDCEENTVMAKVDKEDEEFDNIARTYNGGSPGYTVQERFVVCDHKEKVMVKDKGSRKWECGLGYDAIAITIEEQWWC